jgi:hypothetical protein
MPSGQYSWLTLAQGIAQLAQRLNDPNNIFWTEAELQVYISTALRQFNSLCWAWRQDFTFNTTGNTTVWTNLGSLAGSPRLRTITDLNCYAEMEYMLMEPSNNTGTWTGTNQFSISTLSQALQRRRDEMIVVSNCNQNLMQNIPLTPNTIRTYFPNGPTIPDVIDVERIRYIPVAIPPATQPPAPTTLYRDDTLAQEWYEAPLYQQSSGTPSTFSLSSEPPLSFQVDIPPNIPGTYEAVVLQSGAPFSPPTPTLIGIPNDAAYILEFGALADLLSQEPESQDLERADYCMKKYQEGLELMQRTPWIGLAKVNGAAVSIDSIYALDQYDPNWDSNPTGFGPVIVAGGIDNIATPTSAGIGLTLLANAPITDSTGQYLQISRAMADTMYDLAQVRACFKMGGDSFKESLEIEKRAMLACEAERVRLMSQGSFSDFFDERGRQQERDRNRYNAAHKK